MIDHTHTVEAEFRIPDRVRHEVVDAMVNQGLALAADLQAHGKPSETLEDLVLYLHVSTRDCRSFQSWCPPGPPDETTLPP